MSLLAEQNLTLAKENASLNELEALLAQCPAIVEPPVVHTFTPGLYSRRITMPKGLVCTSKIHKTEHQYVISKGLLKIWSPESGWVLVQSPHHGVTKAGTRRALVILEETVFTTFHPTTLTDLRELEAALIEPHDIPQRGVIA